MDRMQLHELKMEIETLLLLDHPNVISLYEVFQGDKNLMLVMEHCSGKDLGHRRFNSEEEVCSIVYQLFEAIAHVRFDVAVFVGCI
jgi:serine/threonine protein kinase